MSYPLWLRACNSSETDFEVKVAVLLNPANCLGDGTLTNDLGLELPSPITERR